MNTVVRNDGNPVPPTAAAPGTFGRRTPRAARLLRRCEQNQIPVHYPVQQSVPPKGSGPAARRISNVTIKTTVTRLVPHWINRITRRESQARPVRTPTNSWLATQGCESPVSGNIFAGRGFAPRKAAGATPPGVPYRERCRPGVSARRLRNQESRSSRATSLSQPANISDGPFPVLTDSSYHAYLSWIW